MIRKGGTRRYSIDQTPVVGIVLYHNGKAFYRNEQGWLEHCEFPDVLNMGSWLYNHKPFCSDVNLLDRNPVKANKVNLDRTDDYYVGHKSKGYWLYLHCDTAVPLGEFQFNDGGEHQRHYATYFTVPIACTTEAIDGKGKEERKEIIVCCGHRWEDTPKGEEFKALTERLKQQGISISSYDLQRLLALYTLTPKS